MRHFYHNLIVELENKRRPVLASILATRGSAPQVPGASAVFSAGGLLNGTLGGGIMEGDATRRAMEIMEKGHSIVYEFGLNADFSSTEGAICGGTVTIVLDASPDKNYKAFKDLVKSVDHGKAGVLVTRIKGRDRALIEKSWFELGEAKGNQSGKDWQELGAGIAACYSSGSCHYTQISETLSVFMEPVYPLPKLVIAGAGHIGRALAHMANLLDFEVTVIDDRPEHANQGNIPDADHIIVDPIGKALKGMNLSGDSYIVIVTRGHRDDTDALRACIDRDVRYIGMIGSRKKIRTVRENFLSEGWSTASQFDRVHAPVGLEIGSTTVQEIAVSICAQLVQVRNKTKEAGEGGSQGTQSISALILAAGESSRMGRPKMLLPFGERSMIEEVVTHAIRSSARKTIVVLGANHEAIGSRLRDYPVETVLNQHYAKGMLSSVQCGLRAIQNTPDAAMILLGDQPMVGNEVMDGMIEAYRKSGRNIIVATFQGKRGHPILIGPEYYSEIMEFTDEGSLKDLLERHPDDIAEMETDNPEILRDIDTETDYKAELKHHQNHD